MYRRIVVKLPVIKCYENPYSHYFIASCVQADGVIFIDALRIAKTPKKRNGKPYITNRRQSFKSVCFCFPFLVVIIIPVGLSLFFPNSRPISLFLWCLNEYYIILYMCFDTEFFEKQIN
jgi:hypothetical protein